MRRAALVILAGLLLCGQSPVRNFPPGTFQSRAPLDAAGAPPAYTGPGDVVASPFALYALRAATSATRGNKLVNVCIPADVACADLSSDATTGLLVISTIGGSSCSIVTCTIKTWYDISGSTHCNTGPCDFTNATIANRPVLTTSCIGSLPCATWGSTAFLSIVGGFTIDVTAQPLTITALINPTSLAADAAVWGLNNGGTGIFYSMQSSGTTIAVNAGSSATGETLTVGTWAKSLVVFNGASSTIAVNAQTPASVNTGTTGIPASAASKLGSNTFSTGMAATSLEFAIWSSALNSTQYNALIANQGTYCGC